MKRDPALVPVVAALWLALGVFIIYPFIRLLAVTFTAEDGGLSLENLTMVFSNSYDRLALMNSIWLAIAVAVTGTALGFCFAFAVVRIKMPAPVRWFIAAVTVLPLISPPFTSSIALTLSLGPNGILLNLLGIPDFNIYGFWGTWMSESLTYFPVAFLTISSVLACIDPNFEDAGLSLGGLIAVLVAYITQRKSFPCNALMEIVSLLNFALPGTVVGIAYIIAFNSSPLILTGTMSILVAAYVFRYDSAGIRSVIASLQQIDTSLEEASLSLGASSAATFRNVTLPLVVPALLAGMKYLFIHSMTAISATIFLVSVSWSLLTARILECMTELQFGNACAFSVVLILLVFLFNGLLTLLVRAAGFGYRGQGGNR